MHTIDEYIAGIEPENQSLFKHIQNLILEVLPTAEQGVSYGMPAYIYKGKGVASFLVTKNFLSYYPYSGKIIAILGDKLKGFETTTGSVHFSLEHPIPDAVIKEMVTMKISEIDAKNP